MVDICALVVPAVGACFATKSAVSTNWWCALWVSSHFSYIDFCLLTGGYALKPGPPGDITYGLVAAALPSCARAPVATFCALRPDKQVFEDMHGC